MKQVFLLFGLVMILGLHNLGAQACNGVQITTKPILTLPDCNQSNGTVTFANTNGGVPPYNFHLDTLHSLLGQFEGLNLGNYTAIIEDANLCRDTFEINLQYANLKKIIIPNNAFTPNGDNINDLWFIPGIESFSGTEVTVFNRWGQMIYRNSDYQRSSGWDGTQNGSKLPAATYFYVITINNNCVDDVINGTVTIIR